MNPLFAEQYNVSPANTQGLAVGLGGMFLGRIACRRLRSRTATPVYSICALCGRALTSIVARAGVLPNSKRRALGSVADHHRIVRMRERVTVDTSSEVL